MKQSQFNQAFKEQHPNWVKMTIIDRCCLYNDMIDHYYLTGYLTHKQASNWSQPTFLAKQVNKIDCSAY